MLEKTWSINGEIFPEGQQPAGFLATGTIDGTPQSWDVVAGGFTVGESLADDPTTCSVPVIVLSGMERPHIIRRTRAAGCQYFVRKPYDPNALLVLIKSAIEESSAW